jgi:hypothetical protein
VRRALLALLALVVVGLPGLAYAAACTTGQTTCTTDTTQDAQLVTAINDPNVQQRIYLAYVQNCRSIFAEAVSTAGHIARITFCNSISAGKVDKGLLVSSIITTTTTPEILGCTGNNAGCLVDVDVNSAIAGALTVTVSSASTTATATSGTNSLTVASATGISEGMFAYAPGIPDGSIVRSVSGTTVVISNLATAALASTSILFESLAGLPTRVWP